MYPSHLHLMCYPAGCGIAGRAGEGLASQHGGSFL